MKKGFVALLLVLALVVIISPGVIGRLAEKSMDENLNWAANESNEVVVTTTGFDRGWFTSSGQHRVELRDGDLQELVLAAIGTVDSSELPVLIIDTHLDHGLIPVSSMSRENGSLLPGLGSAVSTLSVELGDGTVMPLPGTLFSSVGLTGALESKFILEPEGRDTHDGRIDWGDSEFLITTNPGTGSVAVVGALSSLAVESEKETIIIGEIAIDADLSASGFGFMVGPAKLTLDSFAVVGATDTMAAGPVHIESESEIDDGRLNADLVFRIENTPIPMGGSGGINMVARLENVDASLFGQLKRSVENNALDNLEADALRLLAKGMKLHFDQLDISMPQGEITSRISGSVSRSGDDDYTWASALMALDATADLRVPAGLVDLATQANPDMHAAIGMGFLRKKGGFYTMEAAFKQGLLTVNGAPMPVPLPGLQ